MTVIPYTVHHLDEGLGCLVGILLAVTIHGEAQSFFALLIRKPADLRGKIPFRFNPLAYIDLRSLPLLFLAGWGWTRRPQVSAGDLKGHWLYPVLAHVSGGLGNLVLAGVLSTINEYLFASTMFQMAIAVNIQFAVANLLVPVPPLGMGRALFSHVPDSWNKPGLVDWFGAVILTGAAGWEILQGKTLLFSWLSGVSEGVYRLLMGG